MNAEYIHDTCSSSDHTTTDIQSKKCQSPMLKVAKVCRKESLYIACQEFNTEKCETRFNN